MGPNRRAQDRERAAARAVAAGLVTFTFGAEIGTLQFAWVQRWPMAIIRQAEWNKDDDAEDRVFRVIIEYTKDDDIPNQLIVDAMLNQTPVKIIAQPIG
jgi:hypothetical protein